MSLKLEQHANGVWYVRGSVTVWRNGEPISQSLNKSTKTKDKREADAIRRQIEGAVAEQNITGREPAITFNAAADHYLSQGGEATFLPRIRAVFGHVRIDQITQRMIDEEGTKLYANTSTRRRQWHTIIIAILRKNGVLVHFDRPANGPQRTYFLRPDQANAAIMKLAGSRYPNPWTPALMTFLFGQGTRIRETLLIDGKNDISLDDKYAILRNTKNGHERVVNLCPRVIAAVSLIPNLGAAGPLFLTHKGLPYAVTDDSDDDEDGSERRYGVRLRWWTRAITDIGLDPRHYTPHTARHSWATWFYSQTLDVVRLRAEGGWRSNQWERYVKLTAPTIGQEAKRLGFDFSGGSPMQEASATRRAG